MDHLQTDCSSESEEQRDETSLSTRLFFFLALDTGLRFSEILNLSLEQLRPLEEAVSDENERSSGA